jgi:hypothetical protein
MMKMKKILALASALVIVLSFGACAKKEYIDTVVTAVVTDENGEAVTKENGEVVIELVTDENGETVTQRQEATSTPSTAQGESVTAPGTTAASQNGTTAKSGGKEGETKESSADKNKKDDGKKESTTTEKSKDNKKDTTKASQKESTTKKGDKTTTKATTTTETTTEKIKPRKCSVTIKIPYINNENAKLVVIYKDEKMKQFKRVEHVLKDKNGKEVIRDGKKVIKDYYDITLGGQSPTIKLDDKKLKGTVKVKIKIDDAEGKELGLQDNEGEIPETENTCTIVPVYGIEILNGEEFD